MTATWLLVLLLHGGAVSGAPPAPDAPPVAEVPELPEVQKAPAALELMPCFVQHGMFFLSDEVTAGGVGGGLGLQLTYRKNFIAQADLGAHVGLGNTLSTRLAAGVQRHATWAPAGFLTFGALWGERTEILTGDGTRPAIPTWAVGLRGAPLRFAGALGVISMLEPGIGTDFGGGLWIELTLVQAGARFW